MRRLLALVQGLPLPSALSRAVLGDDWTTETHLLAAIADRVGIVATGGKYGLRAVPEPVPRPAGMKPSPVVADAATVAAFFGGAPA